MIGDDRANVVYWFIDFTDVQLLNRRYLLNKHCRLIYTEHTHTDWWYLCHNYPLMNHSVMTDHYLPCLFTKKAACCVIHSKAVAPNHEQQTKMHCNTLMNIWCPIYHSRQRLAVTYGYKICANIALFSMIKSVELFSLIRTRRFAVVVKSLCHLEYLMTRFFNY